MSKEPVFVSIVCEDKRFNKLSGRYNFHTVKNKAVVYVREGGTIKTLNPHPYYLCYQNHYWVIHDAKGKEIWAWIWLETRGRKYLNVTILCFYIIYKLYDASLIIIRDGFIILGRTRLESRTTGRRNGRFENDCEDIYQ